MPSIVRICLYVLEMYTFLPYIATAACTSDTERSRLTRGRHAAANKRWPPA